MNLFHRHRHRCAGGLRAIALAVMSAASALAGPGAGRMLYTVPNAAFIERRSGESVVTINDASGSIASLQSAIDGARKTNADAILVIHLSRRAVYPVSDAGLTLGSHSCLVAENATIKAASASVTVPLIRIAAGASNVSIAGGTLDGSGANIAGIDAPSAARVNVDHVRIQNCRRDGIRLGGQGNAVYDNELAVTRCDVSGSTAHAGIHIENSTQAVCLDNHCHENLAGISLACAWATVANNTCDHNTAGIDVAGDDNVVVNNTCDTNATGIHAAGADNVIASNSLDANSAADIASAGAGNTFVDNFFKAGRAARFTSAGTSNRVVASKAPLLAPGQEYFYPPLIDDQHTAVPIVNGLGEADVTVPSGTIADVQSRYDAARAANSNRVVVLHLPGNYTVGAAPLRLFANTCVLLGGAIRVDSATGAKAAIATAAGPQKYISISGGTIDGGNRTGRQGILVTDSSMIQVDSVTLRNFGPQMPRSLRSDVIHLSGGRTPQIVTRCRIDGGGSRGIWLQLSGAKSLISGNDVSHVNQDGVDCDSRTSGSVVTFNDCHDLVRYGVFVEQSATHNVVLGNLCRNNSREIHLGNNDTNRPPTQYNTVACNVCSGNNGLRNASTGGGTNTVVSHNFYFNNVVTNASILSDRFGWENYYSQNYHAGGELSTSGAEAFFNPPTEAANPP